MAVGADEDIPFDAFVSRSELVIDIEPYGNIVAEK